MFWFLKKPLKSQFVFVNVCCIPPVQTRANISTLYLIWHTVNQYHPPIHIDPATSWV
jgi:hypothetical protein